MDLWVDLPGADMEKRGVAIAEELANWRVYHEICGMSPVHIGVQTDYAALQCSGCEWGEKIPLEGKSNPSGRHNVAALRRLARRRTPQTLHLQTVMGGGLFAVGALLLGQALRVRVAPLALRGQEGASG